MFWATVATILLLSLTFFGPRNSHLKLFLAFLALIAIGIDFCIGVGLLHGFPWT
jgi:hypothetical protein